MGLADDIRLLRQTDFLSVLDEEQLKLIAFAADRREYRDGANLFYEGDFCDSALLVSNGRVAVIRANRSGELEEKSHLEKGSFIDPYCLISTSKRGFSAKASGPLEILSIQRRDFLRILEEYPDVAEVLQDRLTLMINEISSSLNRVASRLDRLDS